MKKLILLSLLSLFLSCAPFQQNVRWRGYLVKSGFEPSFTYWNDGIQFLSIEKDSIQVDLSGSQIGDYIYLFVSINNLSKEIITVFPAKSRLFQVQKKGTLKINPLKPGYLRIEEIKNSSLISLFYATAFAANTLAISQSSSVAQQEYLSRKNDMLILQHSIAQQNLNDETSHLLSLMLKNHTIYPNEMYFGFLLFNRIEQEIEMNSTFGLLIDVNGLQFKAVGKFLPILRYDELDLPEELRAIDFSK